MRVHRGDFGKAEAGHLLRRFAFHAEPAAVERAVRQGLAATVAELFDEEGLEDAELAAFERRLRATGDLDLHAGAWLRRLQHTAHPVRENLVLFWHNHFVSAWSKVQEPAFMQDQLALFRARGLGSFGELARGVSRDPAMLRYLDGERSTRDAPNENFARELMELFTTGPGPYTEQDIQEAARAFTGYQIRRGRFRFSAASHDDGVKRVMGRRGRFGGDDVVALCATHPAAARFMATKLARAFVTDRPATSVISEIASSWTRNEGEIRAVLRDLALSETFFAPAHRFAVTRSPARLVTAIARALELSVPPVDLARAVRRMGQRLLDPPSVKGYDGGEAWLDPATWLARQRALLKAADHVADARLRALEGEGSSEDRARRLLFGVVGVEASPVVSSGLAKRAGSDDPRGLLRLVLRHPKLQRC